MPIHLSTEYFASWPTPTPDSTLPIVQLPPRPAVKTAQVLKEPLPNETVLEFRYANSNFTAWNWYAKVSRGMCMLNEHDPYVFPKPSVTLSNHCGEFPVGN